MDPQRRLLERDPAQHDLADRASGIEQDERHSGGGDGGDRHPSACRTPTRRSFLRTLQADRRRHGGSLHGLAPAEAAARESDRHRPVPRDRARVARARSVAFVTTPMLTAATDRPTYRRLGIITYGFDPFKVEAGDIQTGNARQQRATVGRERRIWIEVHVRRAAIRPVAALGEFSLACDRPPQTRSSQRPRGGKTSVLSRALRVGLMAQRFASTSPAPREPVGAESVRKVSLTLGATVSARRFRVARPERDEPARRVARAEVGGISDALR